MKNGYVLYQKEMKEMWRNSKWLWIPIVFMILGISQPISNYYMPEIIKHMATTEGAVIQFPKLTAAQVIVQVLSQYNMIGVLVLVVASMGIVSAERVSGQAALVMVRPVSAASYIMTKWLASLTLLFVSLLFGYASTWYYTVQLFGQLPWLWGTVIFFVYFIWLSFVLTVTVLFSTVFKSGAVTAIVTLLAISILSMTHTLFKQQMAWSPAALTAHINKMITEGIVSIAFYYAMMITIAGIAIFLYIAIRIWKRMELSL